MDLFDFVRFIHDAVGLGKMAIQCLADCELCYPNIISVGFMLHGYLRMPFTTESWGFTYNINALHVSIAV